MKIISSKRYCNNRIQVFAHLLQLIIHNPVFTGTDQFTFNVNDGKADNKMGDVEIAIE